MAWSKGEVFWRLVLPAALLVAAPVVAWHVAGQAPWTYGIITAVAFLFITVAMVVRRMVPWLGGVLWIAHVSVLLAIWVLVGNAYAISDIHVDNFSGQLIRMNLDGKAWMEVADGTSVVLPLRCGDHSIVILEAAGKELDRHDVAIEASCPYVLNVLGGMRYESGIVHYGAGKAPDKKYLTDRWIRASFDYLFQQPPSSVKVQEGTTYARTTFLRRTGRSSEPVNPR